jgi:hypothetical protein
MNDDFDDFPEYENNRSLGDEDFEDHDDEDFEDHDDEDFEDHDTDLFDNGHDYDHYDDYLIAGAGFADSALRAATPSNPRNLPCPTCGAPNRLTPIDRSKGYQCDQCADRDERGY